MYGMPLIMVINNNNFKVNVVLVSNFTIHSILVLIHKILALILYIGTYLFYCQSLVLLLLIKPPQTLNHIWHVKKANVTK